MSPSARKWWIELLIQPRNTRTTRNRAVPRHWMTTLFPSVSISVHSPVALRAMEDTHDAKPPRAEAFKNLHHEGHKEHEAWRMGFSICGNLRKLWRRRTYIHRPAGLRPSPVASGTDALSQVEGLHTGKITVCCFAPAKRMWPEGLIAKRSERC